eukprot:536377-Pelagomonas_calceolata.AAC.4
MEACTTATCRPKSCLTSTNLYLQLSLGSRCMQTWEISFRVQRLPCVAFFSAHLHASKQKTHLPARAPFLRFSADHFASQLIRLPASESLSGAHLFFNKGTIPSFGKALPHFTARICFAPPLCASLSSSIHPGALTRLPACICQAPLYALLGRAPRCVPHPFNPLPRALTCLSARACLALPLPPTQDSCYLRSVTAQESMASTLVVHTKPCLHPLCRQNDERNRCGAAGALQMETAGRPVRSWAYPAQRTYCNVGMVLSHMQNAVRCNCCNAGMDFITHAKCCAAQLLQYRHGLHHTCKVLCNAPAAMSAWMSSYMPYAVREWKSPPSMKASSMDLRKKALESVGGEFGFKTGKEKRLEKGVPFQQPMSVLSLRELKMKWPCASDPRFGKDTVTGGMHPLAPDKNEGGFLNFLHFLSSSPA